MLKKNSGGKMPLDSNWILTIECDPLEIQAIKDPEYAFPNDEVSRIIGYLANIWGGLPEEFTKDWEWEATKISVTFETLDNISGFLEWLTMTCVPKSVTLIRNKD